jgi:hypothetical protein
VGDGGQVRRLHQHARASGTGALRAQLTAHLRRGGVERKNVSGRSPARLPHAPTAPPRQKRQGWALPLPPVLLGPRAASQRALSFSHAMLVTFLLVFPLHHGILVGAGTRR